jgi:histidyl-tRNA synthetase
VSEQDQDKAAKRAQWEEINRAKALAKQQQTDSHVQAKADAILRSRQFQAVKGTRDLLPPDTSLWNHVETTAHEVFGTFGFGEIRVPIFEPSELFVRSIGLETDVVQKEMYIFEDARGEIWLARENVRNSIFRPSETSSVMALLGFLDDFQTKIQAAIHSGEVEHDSGQAQYYRYFSDGVESLRKLSVRDPSLPPQALDKLPEEIERIGAFLKHAIVGVRIGNFVVLRPEATASVCRAYIEHNLNQLPQPVKLYYIGPMFRRERPQKGRYRQFYQIGAEVLGGNDAPAIDAEVIEMVMTFFDKLELPGLELDINSIGHNAPDCRPKYVELLRAELRKVKDQLGADSQRRIETNPLRVLDSKLESEQAIIAKLPRIADHLCDACKMHYADVKNQLQLRGVIYKENWRLVRGLDYYMRTTFEITAKGLGSQNAVCGGGRYDGLVELLGGPPTKGIGFAIGEDRLILSLQDAGKIPPKPGRDVYIAWMGEHAYPAAVRIAKLLRELGRSVELPPTEQRFGKALERASRLDSRYALILGDNEVSEGTFTLKTLADGSQEKYTEPDLLEFLK